MKIDASGESLVFVGKKVKVIRCDTVHFKVVSFFQNTVSESLVDE